AFAQCTVLAGSEKESPRFSVRAGFPSPENSIDPSRREATSSPGCGCFPNHALGAKSGRISTPPFSRASTSMRCSSTREKPGCCAESARVHKTPAAMVPAAATTSFHLAFLIGCLLDRARRSKRRRGRILPSKRDPALSRSVSGSEIERSHQPELKPLVQLLVGDVEALALAAGGDLDAAVLPEADGKIRAEAELRRDLVVGADLDVGEFPAGVCDGRFCSLIVPQ